MKGIRTTGEGAGIVPETCSGTIATDLPSNLPHEIRARSPLYIWTGFYFGGHFDYGGGSFGSGINLFSAQGVFLPGSATGLFEGYQTGCNRQLVNHIVLGATISSSLPTLPTMPTADLCQSSQRAHAPNFR